MKGLFFRRYFFVVIFTSALVFLYNCNCEQNVGYSDPMTITILAPPGSIITVGLIRVKVEDNDGIDKVEFYIAGKKRYTKDGKSAKKVIASYKFDLEKEPMAFEIKVVGYDITGDKVEKKLKVRQVEYYPEVKFVAPGKLKPEHSDIFVGKKFTTKVKARDEKTPLKEVVIYLALKKGQEQEVKRCALNAPSGQWAECEAALDLSAPNYKDGFIYLFADAYNKNGRKSQDRAALQVVLDKTGPQIQIISPKPGQKIFGRGEIRAIVRDRVGVKEVVFFAGNKQLNPPMQDSNRPEIYYLPVDYSQLGTGSIIIKVRAKDELDNVSESTLSVGTSCQSDADCAHLPGTRCCLVKSPANPDGSKIGQCFPVKTKEGDLCDPCTNPCGKGPDGKLMGCLPGACGRPPYRCRRACDLGNPNKRPDPCRPKSGSQPAEYCSRSDITKINPRLGACAQGDNCDLFNQRTCPVGARPPYNNCCPKGFACFPADDDANICIPEGSKGLGDTNCEWLNCKGGNNCKRGLLCTVRVDSTGRPIGPSKCNKMCRCDYLCRSLGAGTSPDCPRGSLCVPVVLTNGRVPLPVGACVSR